MITEIRAPKTGLTAETLQIVKWHKKEGEFVDKEELLVTVETEKTTLDIASSRSGFLKKSIFRLVSQPRFLKSSATLQTP